MELNTSLHGRFCLGLQTSVRERIRGGLAKSPALPFRTGTTLGSNFPEQLARYIISGANPVFGDLSKQVAELVRGEEQCTEVPAPRGPTVYYLE